MAGNVTRDPYTSFRLGRILAEARTAAGLTQEQVAERAGLSVRAVRNIEHGLVVRPRQQTVERLITGLQVDEAEALRLRALVRATRGNGGAADGPAFPPVTDPRAAVDTVSAARFGSSALQEPLADRPAPNTLPAPTPDFVGRASQVLDIRRRIEGAEQSGPAAVLVVGAAGTGKTALAVRVAHLLRDRYPDGQIFLGLGSAQGHEASPTNVMARVLRVLGVHGRDIPADLEERLELYRSILSARRILVVADNAAAAQARALIPGTSSSAVIITSRTAFGSLDGVWSVRLDGLNCDEARLLLARILGNERIDQEESAAQRIIAYCEGLPLAVRVAGARLAKHPYRSLAWLAERLAVGHRRLDELMVDDVGVRASLVSTFEALTPPARQLFCRLGLFGVPHVPTWLASASMDMSTAEVEPLLDQIAALHLIEPVATPDGEGQSFLLHELVHTFARELASSQESEPSRREVVRRVLGCALNLAEAAQAASAHRYLILPERPAVARWLPPGTDEVVCESANEWFEGQRPVIVALTLQACDENEINYAYGLAHAMFDYFDAMCYDDEFMLTHQRVYAAAVHAGSDVARGFAAWGLAELNANRASYLDATYNLEFALAVFERHGLRKAALNIRCSLTNCWRVCGEVGKARALAEALLIEVADIDDPRAEAAVQHALGACLSALGEHQGALRAMRRSLDLYEQADEPAAMSLCLMRLGAAHAALGQYGEAAAELERALALNRLGANRMGEPHILLVLSENALRAGRVQVAMSYLHLCASLLERIPRPLYQARFHLLTGETHEVKRNLAAAGEHFRRGHVFAVQAAAMGLATTIRQRLESLN